MSIGANTTSGR